MPRRAAHCRYGDEYLLDSETAGQRGKLIDGPQDLDPVDSTSALSLIIIYEAEDGVVQCRIALDLAYQHLGGVASADNERPPEAHRTGFSVHLAERAEHDTDPTDQGQAQQPVQYEDRPRKCAIKHQEHATREEEGAHRRRLQYRQEILHADVPPQSFVNVKPCVDASSDCDQERERRHNELPWKRSKIELEPEQERQQICDGDQKPVDDDDDGPPIGYEALKRSDHVEPQTVAGWAAIVTFPNQQFDSPTNLDGLGGAHVTASPHAQVSKNSQMHSTTKRA